MQTATRFSAAVRSSVATTARSSTPATTAHMMSRIAEAELVDDVRREDVGIACRHSAGMALVCARSITGRQIGKKAIYVEGVLTIAIACEERILLRGPVVQANVEVMELSDCLTHDV